MNKLEFLSRPDVAEFIEWGTSWLPSWPVSLAFKRSNFHSGGEFSATGLEQTFAGYQWRSSWHDPVAGHLRRTASGPETVDALIRMATALGSSSESDVVSAADTVLKWGGVPRSRWFFASRDDLRGLLDRFRASLDALDAGVDWTPGPHGLARTVWPSEFMSSGVTKVLSLASIPPQDSTGLASEFCCDPLSRQGGSGLVIYDSRVAAAFGQMVAQWCVESGRGAVPAALLFPVGAAMGGQQRRPSLLPEQRYPSLFRSSAAGHRDWIEAQIKTSWILDEMLRTGPGASMFPGEPAPLRLLKAHLAMFVLGYNLAPASVDPRADQRHIAHRPRRWRRAAGCM